MLLPVRCRLVFIIYDSAIMFRAVELAAEQEIVASGSIQALYDRMFSQLSEEFKRKRECLAMYQGFEEIKRKIEAGRASSTGTNISTILEDVFNASPQTITAPEGASSVTTIDLPSFDYSIILAAKT